MTQVVTERCESSAVPPEDTVTTKELAAALRVHVRTVQRWTAEGAISPSWRTPGGRPRYNITEVRRQLGMPAE